MSSEKKSEIVKLHEVVKTIPSHQQLVKANRLLVGTVFFLMMIVFVLGFLFVPKSGIVKGTKKLTAVDIANTSVVSTEVNTLKGQLIGLVSGSIESKLKALEDSIKAGTVTNSLGTIADLKNDVKVLRSYTDQPKKTEVAVSNVQLAEEVSHLKHLIYMSLASCGLMFAAAAGVWVKYRKRLPYKAVKSSYLGKH